MRQGRWRWYWWVVLVILAALGGFVVWGLTPAQPQAEALAALISDETVQVSGGRWLVFTPRATALERGLIFYPGGHVDARAYAPAAHSLAAQGILVVIVKMPLNLAVLAPERAGQVQAAYPQVTTWTVGGHSLGGAMAAYYAQRHPEKVRGLLLWAAYPASSASLANANLAVLSVSASQDGLATPDKITASRALLPADTIWLTIEGGNHAQFGWYGAQPGDNAATISRQEQQQLVSEASARFILELTP